MGTGSRIAVAVCCIFFLMIGCRWTDGAERETQYLRQGSSYETEVKVCRGKKAGPAVMVLGGVHGDEPAGWQAAERISRWVPEKGTLIVIPRVNRVAVEQGRRTLPHIGDVNRSYGTDGEPGPGDLLAADIGGLVEKYQVTLFIDMHESEEFHRVRETSLGQTIEFAANDASALLAGEGVAAVNSLIGEPERKFSLFAHPLPGSGAEYMGRKYGIAAFTVETAVLQPLADRVEQQCGVVQGLMEGIGVKITR